MTIKEKIIEAWGKIDGKLNIRRFKFHYFAVVLVLFALPLTVILAKSQTNDSTHAQGKAVLYDQSTATSDTDPFIIPAKSLEDDEETYIAPNDLKAASLVNAKDLSTDEKALNASSVVQASSVKKPNIVFILVDDMPYIDDRIFDRLPTIKDMFIDHGVRFTNFYGETPLCCPGRAGYLTGQHTANHKVVENNANLFNPSETIATELHKAGYYTFLSGKYLNGFDATKQKTLGWDNFSGFGGAYYNYYLWNNGNHVYYPTQYSTDIIGRKALVYLKKAPASQPIFAYITPYAVHTDHSLKHAPRVDYKYVNDPRCNNIPKWKNANYNESDLSDKPNYVKSSPGADSINGWDLEAPCEALLSVDDVVKKVKNELKNQGRLENTVFILAADNGMDWGAHGHYGKVWPYAGQVNFFVYWPKVLGDSPYKISETVQNIDVAPTFCEIAGCKMGPYPNGQKSADGESFLSLLKKQTTSMGRDVVLEAMKGDSKTAGMPTYNAVYSTSLNPDGLWHYIEYSSGEKELYDLSNGPCSEWRVGMSGDPCEMNNLLRSNQTPSDNSSNIARQLSARLKLLKVQKGNPIPVSAPIPTAVVTPTLVITPTP